MQRFKIKIKDKVKYNEASYISGFIVNVQDVSDINKKIGQNLKLNN